MFTFGICAMAVICLITGNFKGLIQYRYLCDVCRVCAQRIRVKELHCEEPRIGGIALSATAVSPPVAPLEGAFSTQKWIVLATLSYRAK